MDLILKHARLGALSALRKVHEFEGLRPRINSKADLVVLDAHSPA